MILNPSLIQGFLFCLKIGYFRLKEKLTLPNRLRKPNTLMICPLRLGIRF
jgi:hypothetical protein